MIVCWVLFAIAASFAAVGWIGNEYYVLLSDRIVAEVNAESKYVPVYNEDNEIVQRGIEFKSTPESRAMAKNGEPYQIIGLIGGLVASLILLWNIIWHTGHWIWMGRKTHQG